MKGPAFVSDVMEKVICCVTLHDKSKVNNFINMREIMRKCKRTDMEHT